MSFSTRLTVHPPQPAPVNLLPNAPYFSANDVTSSNYWHEHWYTSLHEEWLSFISFPNMMFLTWSESWDRQISIKSNTLWAYVKTCLTASNKLNV